MVDVVVVVVVGIIACRCLWEWGRAFVKPSAFQGRVPPAVAGERPESTNRNQNPVEPPEVTVEVAVQLSSAVVSHNARYHGKKRTCQTNWRAKEVAPHKARRHGMKEVVSH